MIMYLLVVISADFNIGIWGISLDYLSINNIRGWRSNREVEWCFCSWTM